MGSLKRATPLQIHLLVWRLLREKSPWIPAHPSGFHKLGTETSASSFRRIADPKRRPGPKRSTGSLHAPAGLPLIACDLFTVEREHRHRPIARVAAFTIYPSRITTANSWSRGTHHDRDKSSARSVTTVSAPWRRRASACPTRSTPTTKPNPPARPASTPDRASSKTAAC